MSGQGFQFKQFFVQHDQCAMKVGTDGVLLGAWAGELQSYRNILDIGTGSGLVALMLAQRYENAQIIGIDINSEAYAQATGNFLSSPWSERLHAAYISIQEFYKHHHSRFDLITSNPPFFKDSLKNPDKDRTIARHTDTLPHDILLEATAHLLTNDGIFCVILPTNQTDEFLRTAQTYHLYEQKRLDVHPTPQRPAKRTLLTLSKKESALPDRKRLIIESNGRHAYSPEYKLLTEAFYLDK